MLITFIMNIVGSFSINSHSISFSCLYSKHGPIFYAKKDNERNQPICLIPDCQHQLVQNLRGSLDLFTMYKNGLNLAF